MAVDNHLAAVHFRIEMAGQSLEQAIAFLQSRRVFQGLMRLRAAIGDLQHAATYLKDSGKYPELEKYVGALVIFYQGESGKVMRPGSAPKVGDELYAAQGQLAAADPLLFPAAAH